MRALGPNQARVKGSQAGIVYWRYLSVVYVAEGRGLTNDTNNDPLSNCLEL